MVIGKTVFVSKAIAALACSIMLTAFTTDSCGGHREDIQTTYKNKTPQDKCDEGEVLSGKWVYSDRAKSRVYRIVYRNISHGACRKRVFDYPEAEVKRDGLKNISTACVGGIDTHYPECIDFSY
jgi:hypothetical protein